MMQLVHGGDWAGYRAQYGQDALDFSANVSPLGLPEGVAKAITAALTTADRYPDPLCRALRAKLAMEKLRELKAGRDVEPTVLLPVTLILRDSTRNE